MQIKWIELNGFKSFPEKTKIELHDGITCFVGPNGAGKSNIVDAFRWILGEHNPRILRGEKMEEVIFQGSTSKKEKGLAEVSIFLSFDNEEDNGNKPQGREIEIKRRLYRTGESDFIINGKQSRLKDIKEIFISEGVDIRTYSIIDQLKVNEVLSKSSHRKALLEECAGISLYKMKKAESEVKLQSAKENLQRIEDILGELKKQYSLLERQAKRAEKYRKILNELSDLELKVSKAESIKLMTELTKIKDENYDLEIKYKKLKEDNTIITSKLGEQKNKASQMENFVQQKENEINNNVIEKAKIEKELALLFQEEKNKTEGIERLRQENYLLSKEIEKIQIEVKESQIQVEEIEEKLNNLQKEIIIYEEHLLNFQQRVAELENIIEKERKYLFNLTTELANKKNSYQSIKKSIEIDQNRLNSFIYKKQELAQKIKKLESELKDKEIKIKNLKNSLQLEQDELKRLIDNLSLFDKALDEKNQKLIQKKKEEAIITGKLEALASEIWEEDKKSRLFFECIEVSPEVEELIEIFFDEKLSANVIEDVEQITSSNNKKFFFLKNLTTIKEKTSCSAGLKGIKEFINIKDTNINDEVFENIFIVENIKEAVEKIKQFPLCCFITKKGEVIYPDGFIKTGKAGNLLKKRRILEQLQGDRKQIVVDIEILEKDIQAMQAEKEELRNKIESKKSYINNLKGELFRLEEQYKNLQRETEGIRQRAKYMENEEKTIQGEIKENTKLIETVKREIEDISISIDDTETKIEEIKNQQRHILKENEEKKEILSNKKIELSALRERVSGKNAEIIKLNENIKKLLAKRNKNEEEIKQMLKKIEQIQNEYTEKLKKSELLIKENEKLKEELENILNSLKFSKTVIDELEKDYQNITEEIQNTTAILGEKRAKESELKVKLENLWNEIYNLYGKDIFQEPIEPADETALAKEKIAQLRAQLKDIGPVDMEILKEYEEVKERYDFMLNQQKDLKTSIEELEEAIRKINSLTRKKLRETFGLLKEKFNYLFQELFGGGRAETFLTDENNILEAELEINIQPPGKKMSSLNLLSGGEKTLTAIAFVFACFSIRPSPICILDEVDAPLDDPNTIRLKKLIQTLSDKTQFLIITHNKLMMEAANYIYGVTMQEEGVSKVISLELKEAEVYA